MSLPVLLYSQRCRHSQSLLRSVGAESLADRVRLACVDNMLDQVPAYVDRIPAMIVQTAGGQRALFGSELQARLCELIQGGDAGPQASDPCSFHEFSGITDDGAGMSQGAGLASANEDIHIYCPEDSDAPHAARDAGGGGGGGRKEDPGDLDNLIARRAREIDSAFRQGAPVR